MSIGRLLAKFAKSIDATGVHRGVHELGDLKWSARSTPSTGWLACDGAAISRTTYAALFGAIGTAYGAGDGTTTFNVPDYRGRGPMGAGTGEVSETFTAVNSATDSITVASNADKWITGMPVTFTTTNSLPAPLTTGASYAVIRVDATTIKVAANAAAALAGTAIDLTGAGLGFQTMRSAMTARTRGAMGGEEKHASSTNEIPVHGHPFMDVNAAPSSPSGSLTGGFLKNGNTNIVRAAFTGTPTINAGEQIGGTGGSGAHNNMQPYTVSNVFIYAGV